MALRLPATTQPFVRLVVGYTGTPFRTQANHSYRRIFASVLLALSPQVSDSTNFSPFLSERKAAGQSALHTNTTRLLRSGSLLVVHVEQQCRPNHQNPPMISLGNQGFPNICATSNNNHGTPRGSPGCG